jgi:hypothetical protein
VELSQFLTALVGAFFGAAGWLVVGLYIQRRAAERQARNAARAVYFELVMNEIDVTVATDHVVFQPLRRGSFDRLLPELATWLEPEQLELIVRAYMSHSGYEQAQRDEKLPVPVRKALLRTVLEQHQAATELLRARAFSVREAARLSTSPAGVPGTRNG